MSNDPRQNLPPATDLTFGTLLRDRSKPANICCAKCQYDLSATPVDSRCPECGSEVLASLLHYAERANRSRSLPARTIAHSMRAIWTLILLLVGMGLAAFIGRCSL